MIETLLLRNLTWIKGIARTFCRNRMDAEDLVGETVLKVLQNASSFDIDKSFRLWVLVIMRNTSRNKLRRAGIVTPFEHIPDSYVSDDPSARFIVSESMRAVEEYAKSSACVRCAMLYAYGYSYSEIAEMQGITVNIVKSRILHGRRLVVKRLNVSKS